MEAAAAPRVFTPAACAADADAAPGAPCLAPARDARIVIVMRRLPRPAGPAPRGRDVLLRAEWRGVRLPPPLQVGPASGGFAFASVSPRSLHFSDILRIFVLAHARQVFSSAPLLNSWPRIAAAGRWQTGS